MFHGRDDIQRGIWQLERLLDLTGAPATARWASNSPWLALRHEVAPLLIVITREGDPVAAALLVRVSKAGVSTLRTPGPVGEPSSLPAVDEFAAAELGTAVLDVLRAQRRPWSLDLRDLLEGDPVVGFLAAADAAVVVDGVVLNPVILFSAGLPLTTYLSSNTRKALAKARNRVIRAGLHQDLRWLVEPVEIEMALPEVIALHRQRNRQLRGFATLDRAAERELFSSTVLGHARGGRCRLLTLRLDGELAAFAACFVSGRSLYVYANLVSPDWLEYSAGAVANAEIVRAAHADPAIGLLDWGPGVQRYKTAGKAVVRPLVSLQRWSPAVLRPAVKALSTSRRGLLALAAVRILARPRYRPQPPVRNPGLPASGGLPQRSGHDPAEPRLR